MLERLCYRTTSRPDGSVDVGLLAESILFYGRVQYSGAANSLIALARVLGPDALSALIDSQLLDFRLTPQLNGAITQDINRGLERHDIAFITPRRQDVQRSLDEAMRERGGGKQSTIVIRRLLDSVRWNVSPSLNLHRVRAEIRSPVFANTLSDWARILLPNLPSGPLFEVWDLAKTFQIGVKFDLNLLGTAIGQTTAMPGFRLGRSDLVAHYLESFAALTDASEFDGDLVCGYVPSMFMRSRILPVIQRTAKNQEQVGEFIEMALENVVSIREAVNLKQVSMMDVIHLAERASKFRDWVNGIPPEGRLLREYAAALTRESWADKLPAKRFRWAFFTASGMAADIHLGSPIGTAAGIGLSAIDAFLLERYIRGWRPNQFVVEGLKPLFSESPDVRSS